MARSSFAEEGLNEFDGFIRILLVSDSRRMVLLQRTADEQFVEMIVGFASMRPL
jgi:hypothetical protein